jgi:nucleoside-diphosphate-sugar epimerase
MRIFITGGAGFIGLTVVRRLVARGDRVVAMVRDAERAASLHDLGVELRIGDLSRTPAIVDAMRGNDAAIHLAGDCRIGIAARERQAMHDANVGATHRVLDAAATAGLERLVHASTVNVFGNTHGRIVDERFRRDLADGFLSYYDETKFLSHRAVEERIAGGAPIAIAMPGTVYGPGDDSAIGQQLRGAYEGTLRYRAVTNVGISATFVEDAAAGLVAVLDRGRIGESYILAGQNVRLEDAMTAAARLGHRHLPRLAVPPTALHLAARMPGGLARLAGLPEDLGEVLRSSEDVTFWASSAKAAADLGYGPRDIGSGLRATFGGD